MLPSQSIRVNVILICSLSVIFINELCWSSYARSKKRWFLVLRFSLFLGRLFSTCNSGWFLKLNSSLYQQTTQKGDTNEEMTLSVSRLLKILHSRGVGTFAVNYTHTFTRRKKKTMTFHSQKSFQFNILCRFKLWWFFLKCGKCESENRIRTRFFPLGQW